MIDKKEDVVVPDFVKHTKQIAVNSEKIRSALVQDRKNNSKFLRELLIVLKAVKAHSDKIDEFNKKIDSMEDTLYCLHTNIKQNQFLHANPE